jgi:hypothetical protein
VHKYSYISSPKRFILRVLSYLRECFPDLHCSALLSARWYTQSLGTWGWQKLGWLEPSLFAPLLPSGPHAESHDLDVKDHVKMDLVIIWWWCNTIPKDVNVINFSSPFQPHPTKRLYQWLCWWRKCLQQFWGVQSHNNGYVCSIEHFGT